MQGMGLSRCRNCRLNDVFTRYLMQMDHSPAVSACRSEDWSEIGAMRCRMYSSLISDRRTKNYTSCCLGRYQVQLVLVVVVSSRKQ